MLILSLAVSEEGKCRCVFPGHWNRLVALTQHRPDSTPLQCDVGEAVTQLLEYFLCFAGRERSTQKLINMS